MEHRVVWSTVQYGAPKEAQRRLGGRGGGEIEKNGKKNPTFGPRSMHGYFKNKSGHSVFYIYRFVQKLKWLYSGISKQIMTMRSILYFYSELRTQRASFVCVQLKGAQNCPASAASFVFTIEGSIEEFGEHSERWHTAYCLPKWLASELLPKRVPN